MKIWSSYIEMEREAFILACEAHKYQKYADNKPYLLHLFDVVNVLLEFYHNESRLIAAAWLHDVIEDTPLNYHDVLKATNIEVADIVYDLTDELAKNRKGRKEKTLPKVAESDDALTVKLADWIANVRESHRQAAIHGPGNYLQMYRKDFPSFEEECADPTPNSPLAPMWNTLKTLLE